MTKIEVAGAERTHGLDHRQAWRRGARIFGLLAGAPGMIYLLAVLDWHLDEGALIWPVALVGVPLQFVPLAWTADSLVPLFVLAVGLTAGEPEDKLDVHVDVLTSVMPRPAAEAFRQNVYLEWSRTDLSSRADQRAFRRRLLRIALPEVFAAWRSSSIFARVTPRACRFLAALLLVVCVLTGFSLLLLHSSTSAALIPIISLQVSASSTIISLVMLWRSLWKDDD